MGFLKTGITPARPLPFAERFTEWLNKGHQGEMRYLERQSAKRLNPALVMPGARSIVVLAMNYHAGRVPVAGRLAGKISSYARGGDYHEVVQGRLERLLDFVRSLEPSAKGICTVDAGAVMEKAWGAQTALGWMGKHTNLITREAGSWLFLGTILLNLELEYDNPAEDCCGKCRRCIDACPAGAIVAPYVLDARRCVAYLTIELRGPIPEDLRPLVGNRIFGCDECQEACPWNRFETKAMEGAFEPLEENLAPDLPSLTRLTDRQFRHRFRGSAVLRAGRDGFVRNVVVALGNSGSPEAIPALEKALLDSSPVVREHAEWALKNLGALPRRG